MHLTFLLDYCNVINTRLHNTASFITKLKAVTHRSTLLLCHSVDSDTHIFFLTSSFLVRSHLTYWPAALEKAGSYYLWFTDSLLSVLEAYTEVHFKWSAGNFRLERFCLSSSALVWDNNGVFFFLLISWKFWMYFCKLILHYLLFLCIHCCLACWTLFANETPLWLNKDHFSLFSKHGQHIFASLHSNHHLRRRSLQGGSCTIGVLKKKWINVEGHCAFPYSGEHEQICARGARSERVLTAARALSWAPINNMIWQFCSCSACFCMHER